MNCALRVSPVPSWVSEQSLGAKLLASGVVFEAVFKKKKRVFAVVTFSCPEHKEEAQRLISQGLVDLGFKESKAPASITVRDAEYVALSRTKEKRMKRLRDDEESDKPKKPKLPVEVKDVRDFTTPLWKLAYEEQLVLKKEQVEKKLRFIAKEMTKTYRDDPEVVLPAYPDELLCSIDEVYACPEPVGYRNKMAFTIAKGFHSDLVVGFQAGKFLESGGSVIAAEPDECINIPQVSKDIAKLVQNFLCSSSQKVHFRSGNDVESSGYWRALLVRVSSKNREMLVLIQVDPKGFIAQTNAEEELIALKHEFVQVLQNWAKAQQESNSYSIVSILWQEYSGCSNAAPFDLPSEILYGQSYLTDSLCGMNFRVQADSFFQVNNSSAEILYNLAGSWLNLDPSRSVLLDVCCGTGTIGLLLSSKCKKVLGLEVVPAAIQDAKFNAELNGVGNCEYILGKCEDTLDDALLQLVGPEDQVCGVVDPPRSGLHKSVIRALRSCSQLKELVYISCNYNAMPNDILALIRPDKGKRGGDAFNVDKVSIVDLFPHTEHCEVIVKLSR